MATPNMNLTLPVPTVTLGPAWASELNDALEVVDSHDHTSGKGLPIRTSAITIDADFSLNGYRATTLSSLQLQTATLPVSGLSNVNSVSTASGDLYWTNSAGTAVQITAGGSIVSTPAALETVQYDVIGSDTTILPADNYVLLAVDCSAPRTIILPPAASVTAGRIYIIKDATNGSEANTLTVEPDGSDTIDGESSITITSNGGSLFLVSNGLNKFVVI